MVYQAVQFPTNGVQPAEPDNVLYAYSDNIGSMLEEVSDRIVEELGCIVSDKTTARHMVAGKSFWRAHLVLGLAQRSGTLTPRHMDVAIAIEMLDLAFDAHVVGTRKALGPYQFGAGVEEGKMILAGDYYLTRAAISALRSERMETLRNVAAIMSAIPAGHIVELEDATRGFEVVRRYVRSRRYFFGKVAAACIGASLSESGIEVHHASKIDQLAAMTASAINSRRDWAQRAAIPAHRSWDLPMIVALKSLPVGRRPGFVADLAHDEGDAGALVAREIAATGALETTASLSQEWASRAAASLRGLFPGSSPRHFAFAGIAAEAR